MKALALIVLCALSACVPPGLLSSLPSFPVATPTPASGYARVHKAIGSRCNTAQGIKRGMDTFNPAHVVITVCNDYIWGISAIEIDAHSTCALTVFHLSRPDNIKSGLVQSFTGDMARCDVGRRVYLEFFANYPIFGAIQYFCGLEITPRRKVKMRLWHPIKGQPGLTKCTWHQGVLTYNADDSGL